MKDTPSIQDYSALADLTSRLFQRLTGVDWEVTCEISGMDVRFKAKQGELVRIIPFETGKVETEKDLADSLAVYIILVFNLALGAREKLYGEYGNI